MCVTDDAFNNNKTSNHNSEFFASNPQYPRISSANEMHRSDSGSDVTPNDIGDVTTERDDVDEHELTIDETDAAGASRPNHVTSGESTSSGALSTFEQHLRATFPYSLLAQNRYATDSLKRAALANGSADKKEKSATGASGQRRCAPVREAVDPAKYYTVQEGDGVKYACSKCGNIYKWRKSLNKHWKEKHDGEIPDPRPGTHLPAPRMRGGHTSMRQPRHTTPTNHSAAYAPLGLPLSMRSSLFPPTAATDALTSQKSLASSYSPSVTSYATSLLGKDYGRSKIIESIHKQQQLLTPRRAVGK